MTMCSDFLREQGTMMECIGRKIGVEVILTPKCHQNLQVKEWNSCGPGAPRTTIEIQLS